MRNRETWQPTKYVYRKGRLIASRDTREVGPGSRLIADLVAGQYDVLLPLHARGKLLDLGCGKVPLFATYRALVTDSVCTDWGNSLHKNEHLDLEHDLTQPLPFDDGEFDTIILSDVLEHMPSPEALWAEMVRCLNDEGKLILNVPFYYWLHEHPHDYYRYTRFALQRFARDSGLQILHLDAFGGAPEIVADMLAKNMIRIPRVGRPLALLTQWLATCFVSTRWGARVSSATKDDFPFGYFLVAQKSAGTPR